MLTIKNLHKTYKSKKGQTHQALKGIDLEIGSRGFIVLLGKSGSGKSTLLNVLGGLDSFDQGEIVIKDKSTKDFKSGEWDSYRNTYVGFVFQEFYIIDEFSVGKNIALSLELQGYPKEQIDERVDDILRQVDLEGYASRKPSEISGGQKQRIAIARALVKNPQIILADEPTGNLDSETGRLVLETLKKLSQEKLVIMVTHDEEFAREYGDRIIELKDGVIINDQINTNPNLSHEAIYKGDGSIQSVIKLPVGRPLTQNIINYLNEQLMTQKDEIYLALSNDKAYMTNIAPNLSNEDTHELSEQEVLEHLQGKSQDAFKLKKSSLPLKNAVKLALSSMFMKKVRLFLMTFLFICSLIFLGMAANFSFYDVATASNLTFKKADITVLPLQKFEETCETNYGNTYCYSRTASFDDEDIAQMKADYPSISFTQTREAYLNLRELVTYENEIYHEYYAREFSRITFTDDEQEMFTLVAGTYPNANLEVMITDYMASMLVEYEAYEGVDTINETVDKEFAYNGLTLTISGIVDTDYERFSHLKNSSEGLVYQSGFFEIKRSNYQQLFMTKETYKQTFETQKTLEMMLIFYKKNEERRFHSNVSTYNSSFDQDLIEGSRAPQEDSEIVIKASTIGNHFGEEIFDVELETLQSFLGKTYKIGYENNFFAKSEIVTNDYTIVGIIDDINQNEDKEHNFKEYINIFFTQNMFDTLDENTNNYEPPVFGLALLGNNNRENEQFIRDLEKLDIRHETAYSNLLYSIESLTEGARQALFIVGGVFAFFTTFLMFTFISSSINNKQKEIGTLRAIGARGIDVSKIFITEGIIIALFSTIISNIALTIIINIINNSITREFDVKLVLLYMNILSVVIVLGLALVVVFLSAFLPIKRITLMKPIKAIKNSI